MDIKAPGRTKKEVTSIVGLYGIDINKGPSGFEFRPPSLSKQQKKHEWRTIMFAAFNILDSAVNDVSDYIEFVQ